MIVPCRSSLCGIALAVLVAVLAAGDARAQDQSPIFTITGVQVDETAESAAAARDVALAQGQRMAAERLLRRLVARSDDPLLPPLETVEVSDLVQNLQIVDEKTSSTRYLATLTVRFKPDRVRDILRNAGVSFSEALSRPRLVLPVLQSAGAVVLWDVPNAWRDAWETNAASPDAVIPFVLPQGDLTDMGTISATQALRGDERALDAIARRYGVRDVLVAHATLVQDLSANVPRLHVSLRQSGPSGNGVLIQSYTGESRDQVLELMAEGVQSSVALLEDEWKRSNYLRFDTPVRLSASLQLGDLADWLEMERRLEGLAVVQKVELASITRTDAQVVIHYLGGPDQLAFALAQRDVELLEEGGFWSLRLTRRASGNDR